IKSFKIMKKKPLRFLFLHGWPENKWPAKITLFIFLACIFQIKADPGNQGDKLSLDLESVTLERALAEIESLSEYRFMYEHNVIPLKKIVSLKTDDQELGQVLTQLLKNTSIIYKLRGRQVILLKKMDLGSDQGSSFLDPTPAPTVQNTVTGTVVDQAGIPLLGANILIKGTNQGSQTDFDGNFSIEAEIGDVL